MSITIYGLGLSPFVRKVLVTMLEKGMDYQLKPVNIFPAPDWFAEISPLKRIPVMKDETGGGDVVLPDSSAICAYLEKKQPAPALYPAEAADYGRALWFEEYADSALAAEVGMGVFRPIVLSAMMGKEPDLATAEKAMNAKLPPLFDYLESQIKGREFFVGDVFSIADISVATHFINMRHAARTPDAANWPELAAFIDRISARPSFAKLIEGERAMVPGSIA